MMNTLPGINQFPKVVLNAPDGASAEIYLHGAHVTSWTPASGSEQLFLSPKAMFQPGMAIRGGVPIIFPQFAGMGPLPKHGFARTQPWEPVQLEDGFASFSLADNESTRAVWPHAFLAEYTVEIGGDRLELTLNITNTGSTSFTFTSALHTYLAVDDLSDAAVSGLTGLGYEDTANGGEEAEEAEARITFNGEVDRIYFETRKSIDLEHPGGPLRMWEQGFTDAVIWNPGAEKCAALADMEPDGYRRFVCIEAANIALPVRLFPDESWQGSQRLRYGKPNKKSPRK